MLNNKIRRTASLNLYFHPEPIEDNPRADVSNTV